MTDSPSTEPSAPKSAPGDDGDRVHGPRVIAINVGDLLQDVEDGDVEGLPHGLSSVIGELLRAIAMRQVAEELAEHVTPEVANDVLWCYSDFDGTSEPNLATAALINLIRVAHISDDHMMSHIREVEHWHGYVLGVCMMAESGEKGLHMLRHVAGLEPDEDEPKKP